MTKPPRLGGSSGSSGGVVDTGKSGSECFLEAVKDKIPDEVVEKIIEGHLPKKEVIKQLKKYLGKS